MKIKIKQCAICVVIACILIVSSLFIYKFVKSSNKSINYRDNPKYVQEMNLYKCYQKTGLAVMLGNSITYRINWNELLNRSDIINRGIGSDTTAGFLSRLEYVIAPNPKVVFLMGGGK